MDNQKSQEDIKVFVPVSKPKQTKTQPQGSLDQFLLNSSGYRQIKRPFSIFKNPNRFGMKSIDSL